MAKNLPYVTAIGTLEKMLEKITQASVPDRFTQDFVSTKLQMKGGTPRSTIPFIKKMGFVASDGTPTELYKEYRNPNMSGGAIAKALKNVYQELYEMNEYAHDLNDSELAGLIVQATGATKNSTVVKKTCSTFKLLASMADFDELGDDSSTDFVSDIPQNNHITIDEKSYPSESSSEGINLSYTINLNLPPTTDIEVFDAIFKSLKEHLLQK